MELKTIKELYEKVKSGEIPANQLNIQLDNDCVSFWVGDEEIDPKNFYEIDIEEAQGYDDIFPLYKLLFPEANVSWC